MSRMKFYDNIPEMYCLSGDTLPVFNIEVEGDISGGSMQLILAKSTDPITAVICKSCTAVDGGFTVQLTSDDTQTLGEGTYFMHFRLVDSSGLSRRKLYGYLYVTQVPQGV